MHRALKISGWLIFYIGLLGAILVSLALYWSYGEKKKIPTQVIDRIESVFENLSPGSKMFIGEAEVEFKTFSKGVGITLANSYVEFDKNIVVSIPKIKLKLKVSDILLGNIRFREVDLMKPKFLISGDIGAQDFSDSVSKDFFDLYKSTVYGLFDRIDKDSSAIPTDKFDLHQAVFSFNKGGKYETWKIDSANLRFFSLQNTTYLSTYIKTELFQRKSEVTVNARLLDEDRMMLKIDYKNLSSAALSKFIQGLDWFDALKPVLNGTSNVVMDKEGVSTTISLDTSIKYEKPELTDTEIAFKGVLDLVQDESKIIKPKVHGDVFLKDVNMEKLPILWPDKYGGNVRSDVLKNYTKGTFNNVEIGFDYGFNDLEFSAVTSEKFSISGDIVNTDVIYNDKFPTIEKSDGKFFYDGNNVSVDLVKGNIDKMIFGKTKITVSGLNDPKTIIEIDGVSKGELASLKPLLQSVLKGRDKEFFYNTHDIKSDADIKFYYRDNINNGFDPEVVKMNIEAKLNNTEIPNVVQDVNLTSKELDMKIDENGLSLKGEVTLNQSPSQIKVFVGFIKENDIALNLVSEAQTEVLDKLVPGVAKFADGILELEFEYKSSADRNYFAGKVDTMEAEVNFPYFAWSKPKGSFATATFGGQYISGKAIEISDLQLVSSEAVSSGNLIISLNDNIADEVYLSTLKIGGNDAEIYFNRTKQKFAGTKKLIPSYTIKLNGKAFNASKLIDSFQKLASEDNTMVFDMNIENLLMANNMKLKNVKAFLRCGVAQCNQGNFDANIEAGGKISALLKPEKADNPQGLKTFQIESDNAGNVVKSFGFSNNVENGVLTISGSVGPNAADPANGRIIIDDFKLTKAPILTKLFSLASFTGILNVLTGSGVQMKKLKGNFQMKDNYISISDLRSYGDSLGFSMQGSIHLDDYDTDLSGAVTPSYSVNSMFGKIPLVGKIFEGKEGEGLIATNYSIKGKYPDVSVNVNPLSALTPGFLRNIWGDAETDIDKKKQKVNKKSNIQQKGYPINARPAPAN